MNFLRIGKYMLNSSMGYLKFTQANFFKPWLQNIRYTSHSWGLDVSWRVYGLLDVCTIIIKFLTFKKNSKFVLTLESHISLNWKFQSLPTYTPRFARATLQFLGFRGDNSLQWHFLMFYLKKSLAQSEKFNCKGNPKYNQPGRNDKCSSYWLYFQQVQCGWPHLHIQIACTQFGNH